MNIKKKQVKIEVNNSRQKINKTIPSEINGRNTKIQSMDLAVDTIFRKMFNVQVNVLN